MEDEPVKKGQGHQIGMALDALSVEELSERIAALKLEITRLEQTIEQRNATLRAASSVFKF